MQKITAILKKSSAMVAFTALVASCILYFYLPPGKMAFPPFLLLFSAQFLLFGLATWLLRTRKLAFKAMLGLGILARLLLWSTEPVLEDDYWRYLWDGRVLANGINPYEHKPMDAALDQLNTDYRRKIGWKEYGTIYPPLSILVFAANHWIAADSLLSLKFLLILFDLGTGIIVFLWLRTLGIDPKWAALYFFNPLVLKEIANSSHLDSIAVFFSVLAGWFLQLELSGTRKTGTLERLRPWAALAFAVASKTYPLIFVPLFLKLHPQRLRGFLFFSLLLFILYFPMLHAGLSAVNGTEAFARHWIFNASLYRAAQMGLHWLGSWDFPIISTLASFLPEKMLRNEFPAKVACGFALIAFLAWRSIRHAKSQFLANEMLYAAGATLLLSPVANAWYVLWALPFACIARNAPWILFSFLVVGSYSWWYSPADAPIYRWLEYGAFFAALVFWMQRSRQNSHPNPVLGSKFESESKP